MIKNLTWRFEIQGRIEVEHPCMAKRIERKKEFQTGTQRPIIEADILSPHTKCNDEIFSNEVHVENSLKS